MGLIEKLKLLFKARKPLTDIITEVKEVKTGWKTWGFWISFLTSVGALAAACEGVIPKLYVIGITVAVALITSIYNVVRGAIKSQTPGQKPFFQTSEFWASVAACLSTAIVAAQAGGINPEIFKTVLAAIAVIMGTLGAGQNLAGQQPGAVSASGTPAVPVVTPDTPTK